MDDADGDAPDAPAPPPVPLTVDPLADGTLDTPSCPSCLHRMEPATTPRGGVFWACGNCGQTALG